jgi:hypothetical protein
MLPPQIKKYITYLLITLCICVATYMLSYRVAIKQFNNAFNETIIVTADNCTNNLIDLEHHSIVICYWSEGLYIKICMLKFVLPNCVIVQDFDFYSVCKHLPFYLVQGRGRLDETSTK